MLIPIKDMIQIKSKRQLDEERPKYPLLQADDYELVITDMKKETRDKYMAKPDKDGKKPTEDIINFTLEVVSFKDGAPAIDVDGGDATGRKIFFTGRINSLGFQRDGTPAKTRCLLAYALGFEVEDDFEFEEWEQLLGKSVNAEIVKYTNQKGKESNKITRFIPERKRGGVKVDEKDIPIVNE